MLEIIVDRDSVCMADDIDSHEKTIEIIKPLSLSNFIDKIINIRYLPYISSGKATWVMKHKNKSLAIIGFIEYEPKVSKVKIKIFIDNVDLTELLKDDLEKKIRFCYYAQEDYNDIYKKLRG